MVPRVLGIQGVQGDQGCRGFRRGSGGFSSGRFMGFKSFIGVHRGSRVHGSSGESWGSGVKGVPNRPVLDRTKLRSIDHQ